MEVASSSSMDGKAGKAVVRHRKRRTICFAFIAGVILLLLLLLILGFTVFKAKHAITTVNSVGLDDLHFSLNIPRLKVDLNLTLDVHLSVNNPNKFGFKYTNSSALLNYRGELVGEAPIPAGKIPADETTAMNVTLTVLADRLLSNSDLYSDVISGTLPLSTYTRISGRVHILKLFKVHLVSETTCDLTIDVLNRTVSNSLCKYKTKL